MKCTVNFGFGDVSLGREPAGELFTSRDQEVYAVPHRWWQRLSFSMSFCDEVFGKIRAVGRFHGNLLTLAVRHAVNQIHAGATAEFKHPQALCDGSLQF